MRYYQKDNRVGAYEHGEGVVTAQRYGLRHSGEWHRRAVNELANFMIGRPPNFVQTDGEIADYLQPTGLWDPPENSELILSVGPGGSVEGRINLGQWLVRDPDDGFCIMDHEEFTTIYEAFDAEKV